MMPGIISNIYSIVIVIIIPSKLAHTTKLELRRNWVECVCIYKCLYVAFLRVVDIKTWG